MTIRTPGSLAKLGSPGHLTHITGPKPNFSPAVEFFRRGLARGEKGEMLPQAALSRPSARSASFTLGRAATRSMKAPMLG